MPGKTLPKTDGEQPVAGRLKLNGFSNTLLEANKRGTKVWMIVEAEIDETGIKTEKVGPVRIERAKIIRHCPIPQADAEGPLNEYAEYVADLNEDGSTNGKLIEIDKKK